MRFAFAHIAANSSILCVVGVLICLGVMLLIKEALVLKQLAGLIIRLLMPAGKIESVKCSLLQTISCLLSYKLGELQVHPCINKREKSKLT